MKRELQPLREVHGADRDRSGHARSAEGPAPGLRTGHASGGDRRTRRSTGAVGSRPSPASLRPPRASSTNSTQPSASATWRGPATGSKRSGAGAGAVEHPHQRPVVNLLRMARGELGPGRGGDRRLPPMRRHRPMPEPIHPGETLREDLHALGHERGGACAAHRGTGEPHHPDSQRPARRHRRHGTAPRPLLRHLGRVLAQSPEALRAAACGARERRSDRPAAHPGCRQ